MKSFGTLLAGALCAASIVASGSAASASTTLFSNLGSGGSYSTSGLIGGIPAAFAFVATASGDVGQIDLALSVIDASGAATVSLWTDTGGDLGSELGSWTVFPPVRTVEPENLATISGISGVDLTAGRAYFLEVSDPGGFAWMYNNQGKASQWIWGGVSRGLSLTGAFDVLSTSAVPEPATWAMLILGAGMIGAAARRRRAGLALA